MNQQELNNENRNLAEEKRMKDSFIDIMAQVLNKYGRTVLGKTYEKGGVKHE